MSDAHDTQSGHESEEEAGAAATLFDLRTVIGVLFGVYGVVLLIIALLDSGQAEIDKAGGVHINLWSGIVMLLAAGAFFAWVKMRPPLTGHIDEDLPGQD